MNSRLTTAAITLMLLVLNASSAWCAPSYSLQQLSGIANTLSQNIKIAEEDVYIARQEKQRALSVLVPKVATYGSLMEHRHDDVASPDTVTLGIKLTQSFTLNGKELLAYDVTKLDIEGRTFSLEAIRSQYLLSVSQAYYNILSAQKMLDIAESDVKRLETHRNAVQEKLSVGSVTRTDLYRAEAELSKSKTEHVRARNSLLQSRASLLNLVDIEAEFELVREDNHFAENYTTSLEEIKSFALDNRPEIKEARKNLEIARKTVRYNKSDYWPTLSLEAGYKETDISYDAIPKDVSYDTEDAYATGTLTFTLFDGGLRRATIRQAIARERKAQKALELEQKQVLLNSETAFLDYQTAKTTLTNLADEVKSAKENYNAVQMQFQYGMADSIDMMDANTLLVSAQRRISSARYAYYVAVLNILYARGDLSQLLLSAKK